MAADLSRDDVLAAREAIAGRLHRTPVFSSATLTQRLGVPVHLKAELLQRTGSF
jgi:threonine dehydratase